MIMDNRKLTKLVSVTDLRYKTAEIVSDISDSPYAVTKDSQYVAVLVSPEYYEKSAKAYELLQDQMDIEDLERAIVEHKDDPGVDFETYVQKSLGSKYVQNYHKKRSSKISR